MWFSTAVQSKGMPLALKGPLSMPGMLKALCTVAAARPVVAGRVAGIPSALSGSSSVQYSPSTPYAPSLPLHDPNTVPTATEVSKSAEPGPPEPLKLSTGSPGTPAGLPLQSWAYITSTPASPLQPMTPEAELPGPCTKEHGSSGGHTLAPGVNSSEQSVDSVAPSGSNNVPPQVLTATARTHAQPMSLTAMRGMFTRSALMTPGMLPLRSLPTVRICWPVNGSGTAMVP